MLEKGHSSFSPIGCATLELSGYTPRAQQLNSWRTSQSVRVSKTKTIDFLETQLALVFFLTCLICMSYMYICICIYVYIYRFVYLHHQKYSIYIERERDASKNREPDFSCELHVFLQQLVTVFSWASARPWFAKWGPVGWEPSSLQVPHSETRMNNSDL